jgi:virginiamycin A acetyltransferase
LRSNIPEKWNIILQPSDGSPDLDEDRDFGWLTVGRGTSWDSSARFYAFTDQERIILGRYCSIAEGVVIFAGGEHDTQNVSTWPFDNFLRGLENPTRTYRVVADTVLGSDVWIGTRAIICGRARIGHGAVIGAGAVVRREVPPYAVAIGNPAQVVRYRFPETIIGRLLALAWWDWPADKINASIDLLYTSVDAFLAAHE